MLAAGDVGNAVGLAIARGKHLRGGRQAEEYKQGARGASVGEKQCLHSYVYNSG